MVSSSWGAMSAVGNGCHHQHGGECWLWVIVDNVRRGLGTHHFHSTTMVVVTLPLLISKRVVVVAIIDDAGAVVIGEGW